MVIPRYFKIVLLFLLLSLTSSAQLNIQFRSQLQYGAANELANIGGYVDSTGKEYALVGCEAGLSIVDVSNPTAPFQKILIPGTTSIWREVKVRGKYAYVTTEGGSNGLQIINLGKLPGTIAVSDYKYWKGTGAILNLLNRIHSLHIDNGYAFLNGTNGGGLFGGACLIVSLVDPWNPVYMGNTQLSFSGTNRYVHDCFIRNDTLWGAHIYGGFFSVINIANKTAPVLLATQSTPGTYTHNVWLNDAGSRTLFTTDEIGNSYMASYNVSNIGNISELDRVQLNPGSNGIVHNTHIRNNYAIVSWYQEGVAIVDVSRPDNLIITGFYDTYPQGSGNAFNGCWGVYPYLPSGNLVASDINNGLFVLTPTYVRGCYLEGTITDSCTGLGIPNVTITINGAGITKNGKLSGIYKTGTASAGTYSVTFSKAGYIGKTISGVSLTNGQLTNLNLQLKPSSVVAISNSTVSNVQCFGENTGAINLTASGGNLPYSWLWNDGQVTEDRTGLPVASYSVTVTDVGGCKSSASFTISQPAPLNISFASTSPSCSGSNDGTITAYISGGVPPYSYQWSNPAMRSAARVKPINQLLTTMDSVVLLNAEGGNNTLHITDANNCQFSSTRTLIAPVNPCIGNLQLRLFIEGIYQPSGQMTAIADPVNQPLIVDTITVQLANGSSPYAIAFSETAILHTNGWATLQFTGITWSRSYYIVVKHRNSLPTWSKLPANFNALPLIYDFTR